MIKFGEERERRDKSESGEWAKGERRVALLRQSSSGVSPLFI